MNVHHPPEGSVRPTRDLDQADRDLAEQGVCILEGVLEGDMLRRMQDALYRVAEEERRRGWGQSLVEGDDGSINQRIWNLPSRDVVFCDLVEHPIALRFVRNLIGWPALLSSISANIVVSGGEKMVVHADQGFMPEPWDRAHGINIAWCIDDFTEENGGTQAVLGSHAWNRQHVPGSDLPAMTTLEAPAGSMIAMDARTWHTNGSNRTGTQRAGIFGFFTLPIYLPQENWYLSLNPAIRQFGSETLQTLFGFRPGLMGRVNGAERI